MDPRHQALVPIRVRALERENEGKDKLQLPREQGRPLLLQPGLDVTPKTVASTSSGGIYGTIAQFRPIMYLGVLPQDDPKPPLRNLSHNIRGRSFALLAATCYSAAILARRIRSLSYDWETELKSIETVHLWSRPAKHFAPAQDAPQWVLHQVFAEAYVTFSLQFFFCISGSGPSAYSTFDRGNHHQNVSPKASFLSPCMIKTSAIRCLSKHTPIHFLFTILRAAPASSAYFFPKYLKRKLVFRPGSITRV
ncbi:hypothetical protein GALMADRAFT_768688 [Galerina marginata CBS 339.88]|uniref:Uncharacterized protein n=1 Tax=Galerina marginata (strain CBS 339.88) TaxID=685588 RepID=A0A067SN10_GALM3|nr:hypothetical protein GALMADRAFT_768688 [Galerina marginata CBS 339.88]